METYTLWSETSELELLLFYKQLSKTHPQCLIDFRMVKRTTSREMDEGSRGMLSNGGSSSTIFRFETCWINRFKYFCSHKHFRRERDHCKLKMIADKLNRFDNNFSAKFVCVQHHLGNSQWVCLANIYFVNHVGKVTSQRRFKMETPTIYCVPHISVIFLFQ